MMRFNSKLLVATAILACVAIAPAQGQAGQGGGGRQGGQRGGQRGGGRNGGLLFTALRKDVQADLAVTDDEKTKLTELGDKARAAATALRGNRNGGAAGGANGGTVDREAMLKQIMEQREQQKKDLAAILTPDQMKRLEEISIQMRGVGAVSDPEVQKALGLSSDQTTKIADLQKTQRDANASIRQKVGSQEISRDDATAATKKNTDTLTAELGKILTSEQSAKLKEMGGKPFKADPNEAPAGGRRRGGGGGGAN